MHISGQSNYLTIVYDYITLKSALCQGFSAFQTVSQ